MNIYSYPVEITQADLKNAGNIDLVKEYGSTGVTPFLYAVHTAIYEGGIFATGDREIKERIINSHIEKAKPSIQRALTLQAIYMHDVGNVGLESGITITADGQKAVVSLQELRSKMICPEAINALKACSVPILYAGER